MLVGVFGSATRIKKNPSVLRPPIQILSNVKHPPRVPRPPFPVQTQRTPLSSLAFIKAPSALSHTRLPIVRGHLIYLHDRPLQLPTPNHFPFSVISFTATSLIRARIERCSPPVINSTSLTSPPPPSSFVLCLSGPPVLTPSHLYCYCLLYALSCS